MACTRSPRFSRYEFLRDSSGFSVDKTILLSEGASTADALAFHLELGADTPPGEYAVRRRLGRALTLWCCEMSISAHSVAFTRSEGSSRDEDNAQWIAVLAC